MTTLTMAILYMIPGLLLLFALAMNGPPDALWKYPAVLFGWPVLLWLVRTKRIS